MFDHILNNFLIFFLPIAVVWTVGVLALPKLRQKKQLLLWGNIGLLVIVIIISLLTLPPAEPLQVEIAFYALREKPDETYELYNLLGEADRPPKYLDLKDSLGHLKEIPIANSGDEIQLRLKLNHQGYVYAFHFDTTAMTLRQLFPANEILTTNPLPKESWLGLPSTDGTWTLDAKPGLEAFVISVSVSEHNDLQTSLNRLLERLKVEKFDKTKMIQSFEHELSDLGSCFLMRSSELGHGLHNASPSVVMTRTYRGREEKNMLFWQLVQHK